MEFYSKKQPDHFQLIKGIFFLIFGSAVIGVILLFTLSIDRKASVSNGQIISQNAPIKYLAPDEGMISSINIKEGNHVMAGDKMIVLTNPTIEQNLIKKKREYEATKASLLFHKRVLTNLEAKIERQNKELNFQSNRLDKEKEGALSDMENTDIQLSNFEEKILISEERLENLKNLYEEGGISGNEYEKQYKGFLDEKNRLISYRNEVSQKLNKADQLDIEMAESENKLRMSLIKSEADYLKRQKDIDDDERKLSALEDEIYTAELAVEGLTLRATVDGIITDLFTTKLKTTFIKKEQLLCVLNPSVEEEYFAKVEVKEEEIKDILPGQQVHLRLPAFNHYQYGVLKGEVQHVNREVVKEEQKATDTHKEKQGDFYALVRIPEGEAMKFDIKSGFKVSGDIILNRVKLYRFIFESMFMK